MPHLDGALAEQNAIVGHDAHRVAVQAGEAGHKRGAIVLLELVKARPVHNARDYLRLAKGGM